MCTGWWGGGGMNREAGEAREATHTTCLCPAVHTLAYSASMRERLIRKRYASFSSRSLGGVAAWQWVAVGGRAHARAGAGKRRPAGHIGTYSIPIPRAYMKPPPPLLFPPPPSLPHPPLHPTPHPSPHPRGPSITSHTTAAHHSRHSFSVFRPLKLPFLVVGGTGGGKSGPAADLRLRGQGGGWGGVEVAERQGGATCPGTPRQHGSASDRAGQGPPARPAVRPG
jgi:hypothetical protein